MLLGFSYKVDDFRQLGGKYIFISILTYIDFGFFSIKKYKFSLILMAGW